LSKAIVQKELDRRKPGQTFYTSQRRESDCVQLLSGIYEGLTTGAPIAFWLSNDDVKSSHYEHLRHTFRPGHADATYYWKYGHRDHRGGGRSSARETAVRVAAGAIAKHYLSTVLGVSIQGCLLQLGEDKAPELDWQATENNEFFWPSMHKLNNLRTTITSLRQQGDSIGASLLVVASGVPIGLGEPVYDKLDADIAKAMMSINAVKAVSLGDGWMASSQKGSDYRDEITPEGFTSNHAGGVLGGISTGQLVTVKLVVKPTASIVQKATTITDSAKPTTVVSKGRHDPCVGLRAVPVAEAMLALVLMDHWLRFRGQCGL
jgi:chorismate synthase